MVRAAPKRTFGSIEERVGKDGTKSYRARYRSPTTGAFVSAPTSFAARIDAEGWLSAEKRLAEDPTTWTSPRDRVTAAVAEANRVEAEAAAMPDFGDYAARWITERKVKGRPLAARTRDHYAELLDNYLVPTFGDTALDAITPSAVNLWYDALTPVRTKHQGRKVDGGTTKAHTYAFARAVMNTATSVHGPLVGHGNPFAVRGGGSTRAKKRTELVTSEEYAIILDTVRPEWRLMVQLALWTGLRFSEIAELRRSDVDLPNKVLTITRSVARSRADGIHVKGPKTEAGDRDMHLPDAVIPHLSRHLHTYVTGRNGLLFPGNGGRHLAPSTFYGRVTCTTCRATPDECAKRQSAGKYAPHTFETTGAGWYAARHAAGHPTLHFHDLRATGATLLAQNGATEAEIMEFLGDSTPQAAQRYVRAARSRMKSLTARLSALAEGGEW